MSVPVQHPGCFVPLYALAYGAPGTVAIPVDPDHPLPVSLAPPTAGDALAGVTGSATVAGPFDARRGLPIWLTLSGDWRGSVRVLRSTDGGATKLPLTVAGESWANFTANVQEAIGEESVAGASWWLAITIDAGTLTYRVAQ